MLEHRPQVLRERVRARREVGVPAADLRQPLRVVELLLAMGRERLLLVALGHGALPLDRGHQRRSRSTRRRRGVVLGERAAAATAGDELPERAGSRPDGRGDQADHALGREPGGARRGLGEPVVSSVWPGRAHVPDLAAHVGRGLGRLGRRLAGARADRDVPVRRRVSSTMTTSLASAPWSTRAAASNSSDEVPALEGERAERADGRLLGEAVLHLLAPEPRAPRCPGRQDRADHAGLRLQRREVQPVVAVAVGGLARRPCATRRSAPRPSAGRAGPTSSAGSRRAGWRRPSCPRRSRGARRRGPPSGRSACRCR